MALSSHPEGMVAGDVRQPEPTAATGVALWDEFLRAADGGRFGSIDLWSNKELAGNQYVAADMPGGAHAWLVVGQVLYEPLAVSRATNEVVLFPRDGQPRTLGEIDHFISYYLLAYGYADIIPDAAQDAWWQVLQAG